MTNGVAARRFVVLLGVLLALAGTLMATPVAAQGQGYPGTTQPPGNSGPSRENRSEVLAAGESRTFEDCGFQPNSSATLTFNGAAAGADNAEADGCVRVDVRAGTTTPCTVTINGRQFATNRGQNSLVVEGTGSNGAARTITHDVLVDCTRAAELPRTGASYLRWVLVALSLILIGSIAIVRERRRLARR